MDGWKDEEGEIHALPRVTIFLNLNLEDKVPRKGGVGLGIGRLRRYSGTGEL